MSDTEKCARCGEEGYDRRTLWMACFYAMQELGVPFEEATLFAANLEELEPAKDATKIEAFGQSFTIAPGRVRCSGELEPRKLFTIRVCKDCRADWLTAIKRWFETKIPLPGTGTGVYIRDNGTARELTPEEIRERWPNS